MKRLSLAALLVVALAAAGIAMPQRALANNNPPPDTVTPPPDEVTPPPPETVTPPPPETVPPIVVPPPRIPPVVPPTKWGKYRKPCKPRPPQTQQRQGQFPPSQSQGGLIPLQPGGSAQGGYPGGIDPNMLRAFLQWWWNNYGNNQGGEANPGDNNGTANLLNMNR